MRPYLPQLFLFCLGFLSFTSQATDYQFLQYRVENGLQTDIIKCIDQDSLGYIWIGTDEGVIQYNGNRFMHYPNASSSPFIKDFLKLRNGRLLVLHDLGLNEIINEVDTVIFKQILPGTRMPTDSSIWYAKSLFEDSQGNIWISEPQSVVKYDGSRIQRIEFSDEHNSSSFIRSFNFVELPGGIILISSFNGVFFTYSLNSGEFTFLETKDFSAEVSHMIYWNESVYLTTQNGLFKVVQIEHGNLSLVKVLSAVNLSYLLPLQTNDLLINSFTGASMLLHPDDSYEILNFPLTVTNQSYQSPDGNIWLPTEKGVVLLKPQIFQKIHADSENIYVESVARSEDGRQVFFCSKEHLRSYRIGHPTAEVIDIRLKGYYQSLQLDGDKLWASNVYQILQYNLEGQLTRYFDFNQYGRFIFDMMLDPEKNLWFTQEASIGLKQIDRNGKIHFYGIEQGLPEELTIVRMGKKGIFAGSNTKESYLYFKSYEDTIFRKYTKPISFNYDGAFRIEDISEGDGAIWLASSIGLLRQDDNGIEKVDIGERFNNLLVKTVKCQENTPFVWFANAYGLVQYNSETGEFNIYDESEGLPSNTINTRGLVLSDDGIWVGTASGLAFARNIFHEAQSTPSPRIIRFGVDNENIRMESLNKNAISPNPFIEILISSPTYPSNKVRYQYRMDDEASWLEMPAGNLLTFPKLTGGNYTLAFRAKKLGNFVWSNPTSFSFTISKAYYESWWFRILILFGAIILIIITRFLTSLLLRKRQLELEKIVTERTAELALANESLLARNQELDQFVYSTSHDLSAPLKSIRGLINLAKYETSLESQKSLLQKMNESVIKLEKFIRDVISYSRNTRMEIIHEPIALKKLVKEILENISNLEYFGTIEIIIDIPDELTILCDETRLRIILNNLLTNAVKFQRFGIEPEPFVHIRYRLVNGNHQITVRDNGQGISADLQHKIFDMFFRANVSADGSGLGLYILKQTVAKLNGEVSLVSEEGMGSKFIISIPA